MALRNPLKLRGGIRKNRCIQDPDTKRLKCERVSINSDKTEEVRAMVEFELGSDCSVIPTRSEGEEGELDKLERYASQKIVAKCKRVENKPMDF